MLTQEQQTTLKDLIASANSILVMVGNKPTLDHLTCATSLALSLRSSGKDVVLLSPQPIGEQYREIQACEFFTSQLGKQNLVVSFAYHPDAVDKVSYHIGEETSRFYLTIKPKKGTKPLDEKSVEFMYTGAEADLVFLIGVHQYESLEMLYEGFESLYQESTVVSIHNFETEIGNIKIDTSKMLCNSEALFDMLDELELPVTSEVASNLYLTLQVETKNFTSLVATADTFEIAAELIRSGARRTSNLAKSLLAEQAGGAVGIGQGGVQGGKQAVWAQAPTPVVEQDNLLQAKQSVSRRVVVGKKSSRQSSADLVAKAGGRSGGQANVHGLAVKPSGQSDIREEPVNQTNRNQTSQPEPTKTGNLNYVPSGFVK